MADGFVSREVFETFVKSVSDKLSYLEQINGNTIARQETLLKLMLSSGEVPSYDTFVEGLPKYDSFVKVLREIRSNPKMSERIASAFAYNESNPGAFVIMADDINVLEQAIQNESISQANFDAALSLPHTELFVKKLLPFLPVSK